MSPKLVLLPLAFIYLTILWYALGGTCEDHNDPL